MNDPIRDCPHGHMKGKCNSCELVIAEARIAELERIGEIRQDIVEILESRIHEAIEVYAGMEGFVPETAPEAYCLRIIDQMNKALLGGGE